MTDINQNAGKTEKKSPQRDKIVIDTLPPRSGSCAFHNFIYGVLALVGALYVAFLVDKDAFQQYSDKYKYLGYVHNFFEAVEEYSPFHQFLQSEEEFIESLKQKDQDTKKTKVFTKEELAQYDGSPGSKGLYLALLGQVYDVSKGKEYYGPGGGYAFFSAKDGSRAFVTGQFDEAGLIDDVSGLASGDYLGLKEWEEFYKKDYASVGVLAGRFFDANGDVTDDWKKLQASISDALNDREKEDVEKKVFPPCNVEWSKEKGSRYWCTTKSGGIVRKWVGVPRRLFYPGREERCACVRDTGAPSTDPGSKLNTGDLDNPHLKEYKGCRPKSFECWSKED